MGIFKSVGKFFKKIARGVKKVFKKVGKFVGKIMSSKIGKILMIGLTVFTLGTALIAGAGAFSAAGAAGGNLFTQLVAGGKEFALALVGKSGAAPVNPAIAPSGVNLDVLGKTTQGLTGTVGPVAPTISSAAQAAASPTAAGLNTAATTTGGGFLSKAADLAKSAAAAPLQTASNAAGSVGPAAWNFAKSPTGMNLVGNAASGYAQARLIAEQEQARLDQEAADRTTWTDNMPQVIDANTNAKPLDPRRFNPNFQGATG